MGRVEGIRDQNGSHSPLKVRVARIPRARTREASRNRDPSGSTRAKSIEKTRAGLALVVGAGAALLAEPDAVVYADLARWEIHRSWISEEGHEAWSGLPVEGDLMAGSSAMLGRGASERWWLGGSELRLGGASELHWMGASERRLGGASERAFLAASEWRLRGASERRFRGASERRLGGASERSPGGASERRLDGASELWPRPVDEAAFPSLDGRRPRPCSRRLGDPTHH